MSTLETRIHLPPGPVSPEAQDSLIRLWFGQEPIFKPVKYGRNDGDTSIEGDMRAVLRDFWAQRGRLTVTGKPSGHFLTVFPTAATSPLGPDRRLGASPSNPPTTGGKNRTC